MLDRIAELIKQRKAFSILDFDVDCENELEQKFSLFNHIYEKTKINFIEENSDGNPKEREIYVYHPFEFNPNNYQTELQISKIETIDLGSRISHRVEKYYPKEEFTDFKVNRPELKSEPKINVESEFKKEEIETESTTINTESKTESEDLTITETETKSDLKERESIEIENKSDNKVYVIENDNDSSIYKTEALKSMLLKRLAKGAINIPIDIGEYNLVLFNKEIQFRKADTKGIVQPKNEKIVLQKSLLDQVELEDENWIHFFNGDIIINDLHHTAMLWKIKYKGKLVKFKVDTPESEENESLQNVAIKVDKISKTKKGNFIILGRNLKRIGDKFDIERIYRNYRFDRIYNNTVEEITF